MENTFERVSKIIVEKYGADKTEVVPGAKFIDDLDMDSLDAIELCMEVESEFRCTIDDDKFEELETVGLLVAYLDEHVVGPRV